MNANSPIRVFTKEDTAYACLTDLLKWIDVQVADESLNEIKKQTYWWVQASLHSIELSPDQNAVRTTWRDREFYVSVSDIKSWLAAHSGLSDDQMSVIRWCWENIDRLDIAPSRGFHAEMPHEQLFREMMDAESVLLCDKWKLAVTTKDFDRVSVGYMLHGSRPLSVELKKNNESHLNDGLKAAVCLVASDPLAPHHRQASEELDKGIAMNALCRESP